LSPQQRTAPAEKIAQVCRAPAARKGPPSDGPGAAGGGLDAEHAAATSASASDVRHEIVVVAPVVASPGGL